MADLKLTPELLEEIAGECDEKADSIEAGFYGDDDDNESWAADLRHAAEHIRKREFYLITPGQLEEIAFCGHVDDNETAALEDLIRGEVDNG